MSRYKIVKEYYTGAGLGTVLAAILSYDVNQSMVWAGIHGCLSWIYLIYYFFRYHQ